MPRTDAGVHCKHGRTLFEYHGRITTSEPDWISESALVVETPRWCIASDAKNSRIDDRSTARPSAPRQNGVVPPPFNCSSHLALVVAEMTSATEMARPSIAMTS